MRIIHVIVGLNVGGAELMLSRLVLSSKLESGVQHVVVSLTESGIVGRQLESLGVTVHSLGMRSAIEIPRVVMQLAKLVRSERPDIVQTWMYHADLIGGLAARLAGCRNVIWGIRTTAVSAGGKRSTMAVRKICSLLSRHVPRTIVCAAEASRVAHIDVGYDKSKMVVIPNGFDFSRLTATPANRAMCRASCGIVDGEVVIGIVGRFHPAKDHQNFVKAAGLVARRFPNVRFMMVGRELDSNNNLLADWIEATGCPERFVLLGERKDVPICLSAMDIFCLSSRTEGFPNVIGEAMAMALPCVATDVGDAGMVIGNAGFIVPKEDSVQLADGLLSCLQLSPEDRVAMGNRGRARVMAEFSMDRAQERFGALYERLAGSDEQSRAVAVEEEKC